MASRSTRRRLYKKKQKQKQNEEAEAQESSTTSNKIIEGGEEEEVENSRNGCCTPKGKRFRIPEMLACPPAPKKRRVVKNCLTKRSPIAFFAPPDIELFFFFASKNISA